MGASYGLGSLLGIRDLMRCASQTSEDDTVWIPETWGMDAVGMMSAVSQVSSCRLGSSILNVYSRSPASLAMVSATLDTLTGGRFVLGLGASSRAIVAGLHGMEYDRPLQRVRECVRIVRLALGGGRIDHSGQIYKTGGFSLLIKPTCPRPPVYLAAVNPRMMRLAWEVADGVILYLRPPAEICSTIRDMQTGRRIHVACQIITAVSRDAHAARERARRTLAFYVSVGEVYRQFLAKHGYAEQTAAIRGAYRKGGLRAAGGAVPDTMLRDLTACGTPEECRASLERFTAAGVDEPILQFNPVGDTMESFELLRRVMD